MRWRIPVLAFLALLLDGYDTTSLGFVVPTLVREWSLPPEAFTPALVATNAGVVVGYLLSGRLVARYGHRNVIVAATALFALGSALTVPVDGVTWLTLVRLITALGLGLVLPASISLAAGSVPAARRNAVTVGVTLGLSTGAVLGGVLGGKLIAGLGWPSVFWAGALLPALLLPFLWYGLPARADAALEETGTAPRLAGRNTYLLWAFAFTAFTTNFALMAWLPTLLTTDYGLSPVQAPMAAAVLGMGGITGGLLLVPLTTRWGIRPLLAAATLLAAAALVTVAAIPSAGVLLFLTLGVAGVGIAGGVIGQAALAVSIYPPEARTSGIALAAAFGRGGSVIGPAVVGILLASGLSGQSIVLLTGVPVAAAALFALGMRLRPEQAGRTPEPWSRSL